MFKKSLLIIIFILPFCAQAQQFEGGLMGGVLASQIDGDNLGGYNKLGLTFGAWVAHDMGKQLKLHGELRFIQKGKSRLPLYDEPEAFSETAALNYIQMPILLQYHLPTQWYLEGGLGLGYLFSYNFYENGAKLNEEFYPIKDEDLYKTDFCFLLGVGYHINENLRVNLRFTNDILPIADTTDAVGTSIWPWNDPGNLYNKTLELTLLYKFEL